MYRAHHAVWKRGAEKKYLPKLATAEWIGAWGLTEPNTGSDAGNMMCVAKKDGDHYIVNGAKCWITHGKSGNVAVVIVRTGEKGYSHGMSAFIVEKGTQDLRMVVKKINLACVHRKLQSFYLTTANSIKVSCLARKAMDLYKR